MENHLVRFFYTVPLQQTAESSTSCGKQRATSQSTYLTVSTCWDRACMYSARHDICSSHMFDAVGRERNPLKTFDTNRFLCAERFRQKVSGFYLLPLLQRAVTDCELSAFPLLFTNKWHYFASVLKWRLLFIRSLTHIIYATISTVNSLLNLSHKEGFSYHTLAPLA